MTHNMDTYSRFIHLSRYARWVEDENRRETWDETVDRYIAFFRGRHPDAFHEGVWQELRDAIYNMDVMPSMRALMTAGPALERDNVAGYNCAYMAVDSPEAFSEAMYILMCGTGVGFSVEDKFVSQLPAVPELQVADIKIVVGDSKQGWSDALRDLVSSLYAGHLPSVDTSEVRPAGERLKTFGGRASGPEPLERLISFVVDTFKGAEGRNLSSLECHDIMCMIGEVVVCGGVRRSALISLSDMDDDEMRAAKSGEWWVDTPYRALANNSAVYFNDISDNQFWNEWKALEESMSGERGIFNRDAVNVPDRREMRDDFGINPCSEIILRSKQFCNLTEVIVRAEDDINTLAHKVTLATVLGTLQSGLDHFPFLSEDWELNTKEERLLGVSLTGICDNVAMAGANPTLLGDALDLLRQCAVEANTIVSFELGLNPSAAITCVKPSGTVSQLCNTASGIHARYAPHYLRRVRMDTKDSLAKWMVKQGVPYVKCDKTTYAFEFPIKAPEGSVFRNDKTAIEQLELWAIYQKEWCEHKPSITVYVDKDEWDTVGHWVKDHLGVLSGVSFLPKQDDDHTYENAPYEDISEETYNRLVAEMPDVDFSKFVERDDHTTASQEFACVGGACEIV